MKKSMLLIALSVLVVFLFGSSSAQAAGTMGLKAGLTYSTFTGSDAEVFDLDPSYRMGFAFGGYANYPLTPMLSFQPEVYYAMKGAKYEEGGDSLEFKFTYLDIPLLFKLNAGAESSAFFVAGPSIAFNLDAKVAVESDGVSAETDIENIKSMDVGLTLGVGASFTKFSIEGRYTMGLSSFDDSENPDDVKNSGFTALVGMGF